MARFTLDNMREGRAYPADHQRFVRTARGSLYEVSRFLRRADRRKLLTAEQERAWREVLSNLPPTSNAHLASLDHG